MATCSDGDSFYLVADETWDGLDTFDGCFSDSGDTANDQIMYFRGGEKVYSEPVVMTTDFYGSPVMWVLTFYDETATIFHIKCIDADGNDASLIHPTEVTQWNCIDNLNYPRLDAVETSCGCSSTPTTCSDGDSFYLVADGTWDDLDTFDGCFSDSGFLQDGQTEFFRGGDKVDGEPAVIATDAFGSPVMWVLTFYNAMAGKFEARCIDADGNDASLIHPTAVTQWNCKKIVEYPRLDAVETSCDCPTTPAPIAAQQTPALTPPPVTLTRTPLTPTPEPVAPVSSSTPSSTPTPLGAATSGPIAPEPTPVPVTTLTPAPLALGLPTPAPTGVGEDGLSAGAMGGIFAGGLAVLLAAVGGAKYVCKVKDSGNDQCHCFCYQRNG